MNKKWSELTSKQKIWLVAACILAAIALVFAYLDVSGTWVNPIYLYMAAIYSLFECVHNCKKKNIKMAIVDLVFSVIMVATALFR